MEETKVEEAIVPEIIEEAPAGSDTASVEVVEPAVEEVKEEVTTE